MTTLSDLRARVAAHHAALRGIMRGLVEVIHAADRADITPAHLGALVTRLEDEAARHRAFEEAVLLPFLRQNDREVVVVQLHLEHFAQRNALSALVYLVRAGSRGTGEPLDAIRGLFRSFEVDMSAEEERLRGLDAQLVARAAAG